MKSDKIIVNVDPEIQDLLPQYIDKKKAEIFLLWEAFNKSDFALIESIGHRIKGNAGGFGLIDLGLIGGSLERVAMMRDLVQIKIKILELENYLENLEITYTLAS